MKKQNQIKKTLSQAKVIDQIKKLQETKYGANRLKLARQLCVEFDFYDPAGNLQESGCYKALISLEKQGHIKAQDPQRKIKPATINSQPGEKVPSPVDVPETAGKIKNLQLIVVETDEHRQIWNEMLNNEHPRKAGPLVGRQIKYLISSDHGWLGGIAFSSSAIHLEARDKWLCWDWGQRQMYLQYIVSLSRFLIRPDIRCKNLASHVLGKVVKQFPEDFEKTYNYKPLLLESFVDTSSYAGTSYKAANWYLVGQTKGRGRHDSLCEYKETIKDIYLYTLDDCFRNKLGLPEYEPIKALPLESCTQENWEEQELAGADLGDKRLTQRLINMVEQKYKNPSASFSGCVKGDCKQVKGIYRFIEQPDDSAVSPENILAPHRMNTIGRMKAQKTVLCVQDGTNINYDHLNHCSGLGEISKNQTGAIGKGFHMHSTLAITPEGIPLGVLSADITAPKIKKIKQTKNEQRNSPIEEKKTFCWIEGVRDTKKIKDMLPDTSIINVSDREADFYEFFVDHQINSSTIELLVRASSNRKIDTNDKLFDKLRDTPVSTKIEISVPRQSERPRRGKQKARAKKKKRKAILSIRYSPISLTAPSYNKNKEPVNLWAVHATEDNPPKVEGIKPIEWFLLTTIKVDSAEKAIECVKWYSQRWRIEDWHRVLKSGCKIEELALQKAERLQRAIAINIIVAWRIMLMTLLGRVAPELPPEVLFSDIEIKVLKKYAEKKKLKTPEHLGDCVILVGKLGGYLNRKNDPPVGHQLIWRGYSCLQLLCEGASFYDTA